LPSRRTAPAATPSELTLRGAILCFALRFMAIRRGWHLPVAGEPERPTPNARAPKDRKDEGAGRR
jgi:hypothetical protein